MNHREQIAGVEDNLGMRVVALDTPGRPEAVLSENRSEGLLEARFAFELSGAVQPGIEKPRMANTETHPAHQKGFEAALADMHPGEGLEVSYQGGDGRLACRIYGHAAGLNEPEALARASQCHANLLAAFGAMRHQYQFTSVRVERGLQPPDADSWIAQVAPRAFGIEARPRRAIGFIRPFGKNASEPSRVNIPNAWLRRQEPFLNAMVSATRYCRKPVRLRIRVSSVRLENAQLAALRAAHDLIAERGPDALQPPSVSQFAVVEASHADAARTLLADWLRDQQGYRIQCSFQSNGPLPGSLLALVSSELFGNMPVVICASPAREHGACTTAAAGGVNLSDCLPVSHFLPPLLPSPEAMLQASAERAFSPVIPEMGTEGVFLGHIRDAAESNEVRLRAADRARHCYLIGATGTGKSTLLARMIEEDMRNGDGLCVIDPHGDLFQHALRSLPSNRCDDLVLFNPCMTSHAPGINFLECTGPHRATRANFLVNEMMSIFERLYDMRQVGGPVFELYMRNAMLLVMDARNAGCTLLDICRVFEDAEWRRALVAQCADPYVGGFWARIAERASRHNDMALENVAPYVLSKLNQFVFNPVMRAIVGQPRSTIDFRTLMDKRKVLLVNLSKGVLGELDARLLGMIIVGKLLEAALSRANRPPAQRPPFYLYIDEFQNFTTDTLAHLMAEARKFGLLLTLANQTLAQLDANAGRLNLRESVLGNVGNLLCFRVGARDAELLATYFGPQYTAADLQYLPDFHVAARILLKNRPCKPFVFETIDLPPAGLSAPVRQAVTHSLSRYTVPVAAVEEALRRKRANGGPKPAGDSAEEELIRMLES